MTTPDELSYDRAAPRIGKILAAIAAVGTIVALAWGGLRLGFGFAVGALISGLNYLWLRRLVESLGGGGQPRRRGIFLGFRYLLLGGVAYAIVKLTPISLKAIFAGVFVLTAAVFIEVALEIFYARK